MGLSADSATKNSNLGIFGNFWGDRGRFRPKSGPRWPTSIFHTGKEARRGSTSLTLGDLGEVMTHP